MRRALLTIWALVLAALIAGCGGPGAAGDDDPATLAPLGAPLYFQFAVQPTGDRAEGARDALAKIMRTDDPGGKLKALLDDSLGKDDLSWDRDIAPWIGEEVGFWLDASTFSSTATGDETRGAAIIQVADEAAAKEAIPRLQDNGPKQTYNGVDYWLDEHDHTAAGLVEGFVVAGPLAQFKQSVDTRGADSLGDSDRYRNAVGELGDDRLGHWFVDIQRLISIGTASDPAAAQQLQQIRSFVPVDKLGPLVGSLRADGSSVSADSVLTGVPDGVLRQLGELYEAGDSSLLKSMPADAWVAS